MIVIEPPSRAVRDYLAQFGVVAIYVTSTGTLGVGRDLARAAPIAAAWWVRDRHTAEQILVAIGEEQPATVAQATAEVLAAANRLGAVLSEHGAVMARAQAAIDQLSAKLSTAQANGDLKFFNRAYRQYRLGCQQRGEHAMAYGVARAKLRKLLAGAAAGAPVSDLVAAVFER
jgi:hypothetical protein